MSADEFGCGMNNNICTILNRTNQIWSSEGAVYYQRDLMCMRNLCDCFNINDVRVRISKGLDVNCLGILFDRCLYLIQIENIYEGSLNTICRKGMLQEIEGSTINVLCRYDVVTALCQVLDGVGNCCCSGCDCQGCNTTFQGCDSLLENILRRVGQTSVNITCICQTKSCCCMIAVAEYIRRSLINRYCTCVSYRIGSFLSYVKL